MRFPLSSPQAISEDAIDAAILSLKSRRYTMGPEVEAFEKQFAAYVGSKHAVMVNSGSSANLLAVEAMRRPSNQTPRWVAGDEVIVPALAWSTTVWPLVQAGLRPVFVDVDPVTMAINWDDAARKCSGLRTRGMMLIHVLGVPADMTDALDFCQTLDLALIEDCCEAFGARWNGQSVGRFGTIGTFSHFYSHQLPTIEGGMCVTDDPAIADDLRSMRAHGWSRQRHDHADWEDHSDIDPRFLFVTSGYNVRPMEIQAAIGRQQMRVFENVRRMHVQTACTIKAACDVLGWLEMLGWTPGPQRQWSWMNAPLRVKPESKMSRAAVVQTLEAAGIETRPIIAGNITKHPAFAGYRTDCPVADDLMANGFMIGCHDPAIAEALTEAVRAVAA